MKPPLITLLTDFGSQDHFVGAMKGVILTTLPAAQIVDLTHEIPPQDIHAGAFNLLACYRDFPPRTIHLGVVDPGVGSQRRALAIKCGGQFFVGPDNGLFSWVCEREGQFSGRELTNDKFFRQPISRTFHGRDVFAPVTAALAAGADWDEFGPTVDEIVRLESIKPVRQPGGAVQGTILHIDRFGNCVTNLTGSDLPAGPPRLIVGPREITVIHQFFSEGALGPDELFMIPGSAGFVEIAARNASAAAILNARRGQTIVLESPESN